MKIDSYKTGNISSDLTDKRSGCRKVYRVSKHKKIAKMKKIEITPLSISESGQLTGGFNCANSADAEMDAVYNGNCGVESGWWNGNCACQACKETVIVQKP